MMQHSRDDAAFGRDAAVDVDVALGVVAGVDVGERTGASETEQRAHPSDVVALDGAAVRGSRRHLPVYVALIAAVVAVAGAVLATTRVEETGGGVVAGATMTWGVLGAWIAWRTPAERLGALVATAAAIVGIDLVALAQTDLSGVAGVTRAVTVAILPAVMLHVASTAPTGEAATSRARVVILAGYGCAAIVGVVGAISRPDLPAALLTVWFVGVAVVAAVVFVDTCKRAGARDRSRLQWDGWGVLVAVAVALGAWTIDVLTGWPSKPQLVAVAATVLVPIGFVAATSEMALGRVDRVLVHTIVTIGLVALVMGVYVAVVLGLQGPPSGDARAVLALSLIAAAIAAALSFPARRRLEEFANQRVYGERSAPDEALRTFATRMSRSVPMDELLRQLAESLRKSMHVTRAEVWTGADGQLERQVAVPDAGPGAVRLSSEELAVASRTHVAGNGWLAVWMPELLDGRGDLIIRVAPVAHLGALLGLIVVERSPDDSPFDEEEDRVLADLSRQVGLALHNVRLDSALQDSLQQLQERNEELVASRSRIVAAADESRRAIERNLHDGAQQHLVALAVKVGLVRKVMEKDPDGASRMLEELREDVQVAVGELRELAHGIYPPLLRDRGLPEALRTAANRAALSTVVDVDGEIGRFPTEVEAAVYFCCLEAMQNAGKHAGEGSVVTVTVVSDDAELRFAVSDDGAGFVIDRRAAGHGFVNMEDRVGAIGGRVEVDSAPGAGTQIRGFIPLDGSV